MIGAIQQMYEQNALSAYLQTQREKSLPGWEELPDIELYMDQVVALTNRYLGNQTKDRMLTPSMVNNYVKMKVMPPPVKKKYSREHLVYLLVICTLKQVLPLSMVEQVLQQGLLRLLPEQYLQQVHRYHRRRHRLRQELCWSQYASLRSAAEETAHLQETGVTPEDAILGLALKAQAEQTLAQGLLSME